MNSLGKRLRAEREKRGWTLEQVAKKLGLKAFSTYSNWEYDRREPDNEMLNKIADLYNTSTDYLHCRTDDPAPKKQAESGRAYYGGGADWTEEEKEFADLAVEAYRKQRAEREKKKRGDT